jgi:hypothetical protein
MKYSPDMIKMMKGKAALKIETDLNDCANAFVMIAKNASMTGQKIQVGEFAENLVMSRAVANS